MKVSEIKEGENYLRKTGNQFEEIRINRIDARRDYISFTPNSGPFRGQRETELNLAYVAHTIVREISR